MTQRFPDLDSGRNPKNRRTHSHPLLGVLGHAVTSKRWVRVLPHYLTDAELTLLFASPLEPVDRALVEVQFGCGLRASELRTLLWADLDFEERILHVVPRSLREPWLERYLVMNDPTLAALRALPRPAVGPVFDRVGQRLSALGLGPDDLRHAFGARVGRSGATPDGIRQLMGDRNVTDAKNFYVVQDRERLARLYGL